MSRNPARRKKPAMSTATIGRERANKAAEKAFVDELMRITKPVFAKMNSDERRERLKKLKAYLDSLDENEAKRA